MCNKKIYNVQQKVEICLLIGSPRRDAASGVWKKIEFEFQAMYTL